MPTASKQLTTTKLQEAQKLIEDNLCQHYNDEPPCEGCITECPYDALVATIHKLRQEAQADTPRERNWKCKGCQHLNGTECKVGSEWRAYHDKDSLTNPSFPNGIDISQHFPCYRKVES